MLNPDHLGTAIIRSRYEGLLTIKEAAQLLGCSVHTIRNYIKDNRLPCYRLGSRMIRLHPSDLKEFLMPDNHAVPIEKKD